jgi:rhodanese-related sulfurtransferase
VTLNMPISLHRDDVGRLLAQGAQLVEVLPAAEYDDEHLPGAVNVPLKTLGPETVSRLDRSCPVIVYCWDGL